MIEIICLIHIINFVANIKRESLCILRKLKTNDTYDKTNKLLSHLRESQMVCLYSLCPVLPSKPHLLINFILSNKSDAVDAQVAL